MKASPAQESWNAGQLGPMMRGRVSHPKYAAGAEVLENWWPTVQGPAVKRPGTRWVKKTKHADKLSRLRKFDFSLDETYVLELADQVMRLLKNEGAITETPKTHAVAPTAANPVQMEITSHGWSTGDEVYVTGSEMTELNGRFFTISVLSATVFTLDGEDGTGRATGTSGTVARVYSLATAWASEHLRTLQFAQKGNAIYVSSPHYQPRKLLRTGETSWTTSTFAYDVRNWPPFRDENTDETITIQASAATGSGVTLTATSAIFTAGMVGSHVMLKELREVEHPKWQPGVNPDTWVGGVTFALGDDCYYEERVYRAATFPGTKATGNDPPVHEKGTEVDHKIGWTFVNFGKGYGEIKTVAANGLSCTVDVIAEFPASCVSGPTDLWAMGAWSEAYGYPSAVAFFDDRLYFAGTDEDPVTFWGSWVGDYETFRREDKDDAAVQFTIDSPTRNRIAAIAGEDVLYLLTKAGLFVATGPGVDEPITGSTVPRVRRRSQFGTREDVAPILVGSRLVFVQTSGRKVFGVQYDDPTRSYAAEDLTRFSDDIVKSGVLELHVVEDPFRQILAIQEDGIPAFCTFADEEEVVAWTPCAVAGTDAVVESAAVIPHPDGGRDQVWITVARTINGETVRSIEFFEREWNEGDDERAPFYVDAGLTLDLGDPIAIDSLVQFGSPITETLIVTSEAHGLEAGQHVKILAKADTPAMVGRVFLVDAISTPTSFSIADPDSGDPITDDLSASLGPGSCEAVTKVVQKIHHLEGESVAVLADGATHAEKTVSGGAITLDRYANTVHVGLAFNPRYLSIRPDVGAADGTAQGKTGRVTRLVVRCHATGEGLRYGHDFDHMTGFVFRSTSDDPSALPPKLTGDTDSVAFGGPYEKGKRIALDHPVPLPCTLVGVYPQLLTQDR